MNRGVKSFLLVMTVGLAGAPVLLGQSGSLPERWKFDFDSRPWQVGNQSAADRQEIREYVLAGETVEAWSELVTSFYVAGVEMSVKDVYKNMKTQLSQDCPSLDISVLEKSSASLLFEWSHKGCRGNPSQHEIRKIARGQGGLLFLSYAAKTAKLPDEKRQAWTSILRKATPADPSSAPEAAPARGADEIPGVSLVRQAAALREDVLAELSQFAEEKYGCRSVVVSDTTHLGDEGRILVDQQGHLVSGLLREGWAVSLCGSAKKLSVVMRSDGRGAVEISISEDKAGQ